MSQARGIRYPERYYWMQALSKNRVKGKQETWNRLGSNIEKQLCLCFAVAESRI